MVPFEEWKSRTSLTFSRRSPGTLAVDAAYDEYFKLRSEKNAEKLYFILEKYVREHGGAWNKADRNVASDGLMEAVWNIARDHAHPGLGKAKFTDQDKEAIEHWKVQRGLIAERFFKNCSLDIKGSYTAFKLPLVGRTGISGVEVGKTATNASDISDGITLVRKLVNDIVDKSVDPSVSTEVMQYILATGLIPEMAKATASSLIPFKNVITSGGSAIGNGIMACVDLYRRSEANSHRHVLASGAPQAAFRSMMVIIEREKTRHLVTAGTSALQAGAAAVSQVFDPTHMSQVAISAGFAVAAMTQRIFLIGRDYLERRAANKVLSEPSKIDVSIVETHPVLGCYLLVGAEMSTLIAFFANFGNRGWMTEVEDAVKLHLTPLQELAGNYIDDSRFELMRNGGAVYPVPGSWQKLKKWKNGKWETGGVSYAGAGPSAAAPS